MTAWGSLVSNMHTGNPAGGIGSSLWVRRWLQEIPAALAGQREGALVGNLYNADPSNSWPETLGLPSNWPRIPVSPVADTVI